MWILNLTINYYKVIDILWNLYLLIVPFFLFAFFSRSWDFFYLLKTKGKIILSLIFLLWLIFVPNTIYVLTDMRHITGYCPSSYYNVCTLNAWMIFFFFSYAVIGLIAYVFALKSMAAFLSKKLSIKNYFFIIPVVPLISLGVLLGLLDRWNTWDIFFNPLYILKSAGNYFTSWDHFKNFLIINLFLYIFYFVGSFITKDKL